MPVNEFHTYKHMKSQEEFIHGSGMEESGSAEIIQ